MRGEAAFQAVHVNAVNVKLDCAQGLAARLLQLTINPQVLHRSRLLLDQRSGSSPIISVSTFPRNIAHLFRALDTWLLRFRQRRTGPNIHKGLVVSAYVATRLHRA